MAFDRPIDGIETANAPAARVAVVSAARSAFRRGIAQTFTPPLIGVGIWCFPLRDDRFLRIRRRAGMWSRKQQCPGQPVCLAPKRSQEAFCLPSPQIYTYPCQPPPPRFSLRSSTRPTSGSYRKAWLQPIAALSECAPEIFRTLKGRSPRRLPQPRVRRLQPCTTRPWCVARRSPRTPGINAHLATQME